MHYLTVAHSPAAIGNIGGLLEGILRVLKKRPPPISDEEQRLNQRQRCTLSQLRSGHFHLFQDCKHRVFGEPSDICTYCGASPQDVRHLFACTTHPTDLSPEDLWRNPVRSISAFSYLDNRNLDWVEDGPGRGKQQQEQGISLVAHRANGNKFTILFLWEKFMIFCYMNHSLSTIPVLQLQ